MTYILNAKLFKSTYLSDKELIFFREFLRKNLSFQ